MLVGQFDQQVQDESGLTIGYPFGNLAAELLAQDPVMREKLASVFSTGVEFVEGQLREAAQRGDLEVADPRRAAQAIFAYLGVLQLLGSTQNLPQLVRILADGAIRLAALGEDIGPPAEVPGSPDGTCDPDGLENRGLA